MVEVWKTNRCVAHHEDSGEYVTPGKGMVNVPQLSSSSRPLPTLLPHPLFASLFPARQRLVGRTSYRLAPSSIPPISILQKGHSETRKCGFRGKGINSLGFSFPFPDAPLLSSCAASSSAWESGELRRLGTLAVPTNRSAASSSQPAVSRCASHTQSGNLSTSALALERASLVH